jgi:mono/diheme cytochrome c family protein
VIPGIVAFLFASLPFIDRRMERRPWKRPVAVGTYVCVFLALFGLGYLSYRGDHSDPAVAKQIDLQEQAMADYMKQPFQPDVAAGAAAASTASADPLVAKGSQIFEVHACSGCHGEGGVGTAAGPKLVGIHQKLSPDQLTAIFKSPTPQMTAGGMPPVTLSADNMSALVAYLESL